MNAVVCRSFGEMPVVEALTALEPGPGQVRVRQEGSAVSAGDWMIARGRPWVMRPVFARMMGPAPRILGLDVAGVIDRVGEGVEGWSVGDRVAGEVARAWAEQVLADPAALARIPDGVDALQAGTLPVSGLTALQGLRDAAAVRPGERVLVNGASGGVGHFAVQVARVLGAEVTAVCSASKADLASACGATEVIDHRRAAFVDQKARWDVVFDLVGNFPVGACLGALRPGGRYVSSSGGERGGAVLGPLPRLLHVAVRGLFDGRLKVLAATPRTADLATLLGWVAQGTLTPHLGHVVPLEEAARGLELLGDGQARGKTAIRVAGD